MQHISKIAVRIGKADYCKACVRAYPHDFICPNCGHIADPGVSIDGVLICEQCADDKRPICAGKLKKAR